MASPSIIVTNDGSHSLLSSKHQVTYHSHHGAIQETEHVFIEAGFSYQYHCGVDLNILELGFGTGLNVLMTLLQAQQYSLPVKYTSLEPFPIDWNTASQFNYLSLLDAEDYQPCFQQIHSCPFGELQYLGEFFTFQKFKTPIQSFNPDLQFSLVYYDAFAPNTQPELWTEDCFKHVFKLMTPGGVLVTYCAKGSVKRALKAVGFAVESLPGPPGKREMTRAVKV